MGFIKSYQKFLITEQEFSDPEVEEKEKKERQDPLYDLRNHFATGMKKKPATIKLNLSLPPNLTNDQSSVDYVLNITGCRYGTVGEVSGKGEKTQALIIDLEFVKRASGGEIPSILDGCEPKIVVGVGDKNFSREDGTKNNRLFGFYFGMGNDQGYRQPIGEKAVQGLFNVIKEKTNFKGVKLPEETKGKGKEETKEKGKEETKEKGKDEIKGESKEKTFVRDEKLKSIPVVEELVKKYGIESENIKWEQSNGANICTLRLGTERGLLRNAEGDILILLSSKPTQLSVSLKNGTVAKCEVIFRRRYNNDNLFKKVFGEKFDGNPFPWYEGEPIGKKMAAAGVFGASKEQSQKIDSIIKEIGIDGVIPKTYTPGPKGATFVFNRSIVFGLKGVDSKIGYTLASLNELDLAQMEKIIKVLDKN
jgi:hypothetical protein